MKIETRIIPIQGHKVEERGGKPFLIPDRSAAAQALTHLQAVYLHRLSQGKTLAALATESIAANEVFSFRELHQLILILIKMNLLLDREFVEYFHVPKDSDAAANKGLGKVAAQKLDQWTPKSLIELPFFRKLPENIQEVFVDHTELIEVAERIRVVTQEAKDRDLYAIMHGSASIYTQGRKHRDFITSIRAGSVFGEGAFFFNRPRTADVITNEYSVLAKVSFEEKAFGPFLKSNKMDIFQQRLWALHGLLSSPLFQHAPSETTDQFSNLGPLKTMGIGEVIVKEGEEGKSFFVVIQGKLDVLRHGLIINKMKQGDIFGEIALMCEYGARTATVRAETEGILMEVSRKDFYGVLSQNILLAKDIEEIAHRREDGYHPV